MIAQAGGPQCDDQVRRTILLFSLWALPALAGVKVPGDLGIGPAGYWFVGPLMANRGAVPHFGLVFDLQAIIDRDWIQDNQASIPDKYKGMADKVNELKIGASIFTITDRFLIGLGGGAQIYIPQRMGAFFEIGPMSENMWLSISAFLQFHFRFPYEVSL